MTKQDYYRQSGMAAREYRPYQTDTFPLSVHKTIFPLDGALPQGARCNVLYAHWHEEVDVFYLEKGSCVYCVAGHEYHLQAGDAVWTPPRLAHWAYTTQREGEVVFYGVVFEPSILVFSLNDVVNTQYVMPVLMGERMMGPHFSAGEPQHQPVLQALRKIIALYDSTEYDRVRQNYLVPRLEPRQDAPCVEMKIRAALTELWAESFALSQERKNRRRTGTDNFDRIQRALEYIHQHYREPITLEKLASSIFMSREYFTRVFKEYTGSSPFEYLNEYRVQASLALLENSELNISDIAAQCGFNHASYYNKRFMEYMKCTPTDYRYGRYRAEEQME